MGWATPATDDDLIDGAVVRHAVADDAASLELLEADARASLVDARGGAALLAEVAANAGWHDALADPERRIWVAVIDRVVVGYLELVLPGDDGIGIVRQVWVDPEARELGFGDVLLERAIGDLVAAGGHTVEATALPGDRDTKNLYERAGVTARKLTVSRRLVSDPASSADASR
jgi:ribosomal protein S18 acetylase RimI-like enzyme